MKTYPNIKFPGHYLDLEYPYNPIEHVPEGWGSLLEKLLEDLSKLSVEISVLQIKEKFGGLRFYYHALGADNDEAVALVEEAESKSVNLCVVCGKPGTMRYGGWISPYCDEHYKGNPIGEEEDVY
jgi:hypothetical protein